ncbi:MAG: patatin-like phospholipase family protein [Bacteroidia bacterium]|nr:patatin-like phospholipase family protein [Bacteroidia bacterium]
MRPTTNTHKSAQKKKIRVLSIDGGGVKGVLPVTLLTYLESALQRESGNPDARIADYFDFFAGTSTGAILVSTLLTPDPLNPTRPKFKAADAERFYYEKAPKIFGKSITRRLRTIFGWWRVRYSSRQLELELKDAIGRNTWLSDMIKPMMVTAYDITKRKAIFFTSGNAANKPSKNFLTWQSTCASSSAPTFFKPVHLKAENGMPYFLTDGGMFANNPSMCAFVEVKKMKEFHINGNIPTADDIIMLSLSAGHKRKKYDYEKMSKAGKANWISPIIDIQMSGNAETVDHKLSMLYDEATNGSKNDYYRIEPDLYEANTVMDDASKKNLENLREAAKKNVENFRDTLDEIARKLVANDPNIAATNSVAQKIKQA